MKVTYEKLFVKDLFRLKGTEAYDRVKELAFEGLGLRWPDIGHL